MYGGNGNWIDDDDNNLWARGALTVLPQPQLQGASGTVIAARFDGFGGGMFELIPT